MREKQVRVTRGFVRDAEQLLEYLAADADDTLTKGRIQAARANIQDAINELEQIDGGER